MIEHTDCGGKVYRESDIEWKGDEILFWKGTCGGCGETVEAEYELSTVSEVQTDGSGEEDKEEA